MVVVIFGVVGAQMIDVKSTKVVQVLGVKTTDFGKLEREKIYWEQIIAQSPSYRDAYLQLSVISYQLGNSEEVKQWMNKMYEIDPNFEVSPTLMPLLQP